MEQMDYMVFDHILILQYLAIGVLYFFIMLFLIVRLFTKIQFKTDFTTMSFRYKTKFETDKMFFYLKTPYTSCASIIAKRERVSNK